VGVPSKNSSVSDMGRRPELKSAEFFVGTPTSSRDNLTFGFETAEKSGAVIGGATPPPKSAEKKLLMVNFVAFYTVAPVSSRLV
jgi:hypothetical protein